VRPGAGHRPGWEDADVPAAPAATHEFALLPDEAAESGIAWTGRPASVDAGDNIREDAPVELAAAVAAFAGA
jgi:hypothetical protein